MDEDRKPHGASYDALFRSHFEHVNGLADRSSESVKPAYPLDARAAERGRKLGFNLDATLIGGTTSHHRPSFSDPIAGGIDPTAPDSPEHG